MNLKEQLDALLDATAFDSTGTKIGAVRQVYVDDSSGKVTFATVATGIFSADAIVPLHGARLLDDELHVDHTRDVVRDSPRPDHTEDALTPEQEVRLLEYYGIEPPTRARATDTSRTGAGTGSSAGAGAGPGAGAGAAATKDTKDTERKNKGTAKDVGAAGAEKKAGATEEGSTPTTRKTSPLAAPGATPGKKPEEKTPTTTRTSSSSSGPAGDSSSAAKASGSGPADTSGTASEKDTGGDDSGSRG